MKAIPKRIRIPLITDIKEYRQLKKDAIGYFQNLVSKYGDVCYAPTNGIDSYYIHDPEVIKEVLITQSGKFKKSKYYRVMKKLLGEGLFTSEGDFHQRQRRLAAPAFHKERINGYSETMVQCCLEEIESWKDGEIINVSQSMVNITLQVVAQTLFGTGIPKSEIVHISKVVTELLQAATKIFENPFHIFCLEKNIGTSVIKRFTTLKTDLDKVILNVISSYRNNTGNAQKDLLAMLMQSVDAETGAAMSDEQIRDEVMTMFLAGHETTATALSWVWYLLGKHPDIKDTFYHEVKEKIGNRTPYANDYHSLDLAKNIFKESLRLYPPAWTLAREAVEDVQIQDYHFPRGSVLLSILYIIHRKPEYFESPDEFIPHRWSDESTKDLPRFAYFPFGGGNRMCIGEGFAWMEAVMIMATIACRFHLHLPEGFTTEPDPGFTLHPKRDIKMKVNKIINMQVS